MTSQQRVYSGGGKLGVRPWFPLQRHVVSDRIELLVHLATGNLVVPVRDLTIDGRCDFPLALDHVFNAHAPAVLPPGAPEPSFGTHWASILDTHLFTDTDGSETLVDPTGWYASFTSDGSGGWTTPPGINADLATEPDGTHTLTYRGSNEVWRFDTDGLLTSRACRNGQTITYTHRGDGRITAITDTRDRVTTLEYDTAARLESIVDPAGHRFGAFTHDPGTGRLTSFEDRGGNVVYLSYDSTGNLIELIDPNGATWAIDYDTSGRVSELREPLPGGAEQAVWAFSYGASSASVTDPNGNTSQFTFDADDRQITATDALGHIRGTTWTANHDLNTTTDPAGASITYQHDPITNNLIGTELPTGATTTIDYTSTQHPYQPTAITDLQGAQLDFDYDNNGNLLRAHNTNLGIDVVTQTWNTDGSLASRTDGKGALTTFDYDEHGQRVAVHLPSPRGVERMAYDELSRPVTQIDGNGTVLRYDYDWLDRLIRITDVTGGIHDVRETRSYDRNGNLTNVTTPSARTEHTYTPRGGVQATRTTTGDVLEVVGYGYDPAGNITWLEQPCARVDYTYDEAHRCTGVTLPGGEEIGFDYDSANRRTDTHYPGGLTVHTSYDISGRPTAVEATNTTTNTRLDRSTYRYTLDDDTDTTLIREITGLFSPTPTGAAALCDYDGLGRLIQAGPHTYTFDDATNLTSFNEGQPASFSINDADQYTSYNSQSLGWDRTGQLTATHDGTVNEYSSTHQLTGATSSSQRLAEITYATSDNVQPLEALYSTETATIHDTYTHTALGLGAYTRDGVRTSIIRDPDGVPLAFDTLNGARYYPYLDPQGSVQALITISAEIAGTYTYTPYGTTTPDGHAALDNPLRWLGQLHDPHGRQHLGYRYYQPLYARFTQPDPSGQELNPYAYANGDPINGADPSGLIAPAILGAIGWAVIWRCLVGSLGSVGLANVADLARTGNTASATSNIEAALTGCLTALIPVGWLRWVRAESIARKGAVELSGTALWAILRLF